MSPWRFTSSRKQVQRQQGAKTVRLENGTPVATDGPFAEAKESLAGWWIIDADDARAIDIASRCVAFTGGPVEVRQVPDAPPEV